MVSKASKNSADCSVGVCVMGKEGRTIYPEQVCILVRTMSPSMMEEVQYNLPAIEGLPRTPGTVLY